MEILKPLKEYWTVLAFFVYIIVTWTVFGTRLNNLQDEQIIQAKQISKLDDGQDTLQRDISTIKSDISSINTSLTFIVKKI